MRGQGHKCSSGHALHDKFQNGKQLMQAEKKWGVRNNDYLDEPQVAGLDKSSAITTKLK